jgi:hypothetical protein
MECTSDPTRVLILSLWSTDDYQPENLREWECTHLSWGEIAAWLRAWCCVLKQWFECIKFLRLTSQSCMEAQRFWKPDTHEPRSHGIYQLVPHWALPRSVPLPHRWDKAHLRSRLIYNSIDEKPATFGNESNNELPECQNESNFNQPNWQLPDASYLGAQMVANFGPLTLAERWFF